MEDESLQSTSAFIAELRHWREVTGFSQKALARVVGYDPSYVSKVERGTVVPSREFAENADRQLRAGRALVRRWSEAYGSAGAAGETRRAHEGIPDDPQSAPGSALVVVHEHAELAYLDGTFRTRIRRQLRNVGTEPVTQYLIRIAVDRYPGDPERSNRLYRGRPLTWSEIGLGAECEREPMIWRVKHDRDAFKELWLLFENADARFPLYPGETRWIEYRYTVQADKWGPWWQRAIRLPTHRLSMSLDFPSELAPVVWGMETSMSATATPFRTSIERHERDARVLFLWHTEDPPLHARYRIEWKFRNSAGDQPDTVERMTPAERMAEIGIVQEGDDVLEQPARPFVLPDEAEDARRVIAQLGSVVERAEQVHTFAKGIGLAAPQVGISRAAAVVREPDGSFITLLNPRVVGYGSEVDEQYEGCLSFFDVRGIVCRPRCVEIEHQDVDGTLRITEFTDATARLVGHEIDHLEGRLYRARMKPGTEPIPVSQYRGTGEPWRSARLS